MKKILYVIGQLGVGGAEQQLIYLATHLDPSEFKVMVCSLSTDIELLPLLEDSGIETVVFKKIMSPDITRPFKLLSLCKSYKPDLIHSYLFVANTWSRIIGSLLGIPTILSERSAETKKPFFIRIINKIISPLDGFLIANSYMGAKRVIENNEFLQEKVKVIYNGIPIERFQKPIPSEKKHKLRIEFGLEEEIVIGIIGRLENKKNHELLFAAYKIVKDHFPNSRILCVGDGSRKEELRELVKAIELNDRVVFAGLRNDIVECLAIMSILVLPSRIEGLPNVILEAMAAKCPVIATDVGGVGELIRDGVTGFLVKPGNKQDLAEKITYVLSNQNHVEDVKRNAYSFVNKNFSISRMVKETAEVYEKMLGKGEQKDS
jgi:glycosyltransferase involved in cell wall biosynthesis